jgi:two-component system, cell cycle sensor histidine kinase and response regulator CckA
MQPIRVLLVEDAPSDARLVQEFLKGADEPGFSIQTASTLSEAETAVKTRPVDVVVADLTLPDAQGLDAVRRLRGAAPHTPLVVLTGASALEGLDMTALKLGVQDYLAKDGLEARVLTRALRYAVERARGEAEVRRLNTELESRANAMREYAEQIADLYNNAACGFHSVDSEGKYVRVNDTELRWLGYSREELIGKVRFSDLLTPLSARVFDEEFPRFKETGAIRQIELDLKTKSGAVFPVLFSATALNDAEGRFVMSRSTLLDMTERRVAEANMRFQAGILAQVRDAVVVTDTKGRVTYWSGAAESVFGHRMAEATGADAADLLGEAWLSEAPGGEVLLKRKDGAEIWARISFSPLKDEDGRPAGRLAVVRDVTENRSLRSAVIQAEKMAGMGQMAAGVAHELKSPMSVVLGYADLLAGLAAARTDLPADFARHVGVIQKHLARCADLVNNLLDFSRKERPSEELDLRDVAAAAVSLAEPYALERTASVAKDMPADPVRVRGHKNLLEQVAVNLIHNAVDASGKGGRVYVRVGREDRAGRAFAVLRVRADGPGVPPEARGRLFEPFFTTKGPGKGTGLGLWLARQITADAGGSVEFEAPAEGGAEFVVRLPAAGAPAAGPVRRPGPKEKEKEAAEMKKSDKPRIVVVDDEKDFRELVRSWLAPRYEVECFSGGEGLADLLAPLEPDLLILDVHMPGADGFTVCRRLRRDPRFTFLPIVFLTASKQDVDFVKTLALGANSFLTKPITGQELNFRVRELLAAERAATR